MASEYFKWKARNEKPAPPPAPLSRKEKLLNWLHYHKLHLAAAAVLLWIAGSMLWNVLGIGKVRPDYVFAYVGPMELSEDACGALQTSLAALGRDVNGDGRVTVELRQYVMPDGNTQEAISAAYAADARLIADVTRGESYFFLLTDPEGLQHRHQILARADGTPPAEDDYAAEDKVYRWDACPALAGQELPEGLGASLYLGRRCFYEENQAAGQAENAAFWQLLTEGARR